MCFHGTLREVEVIGGKRVVVDACIADEITYVNKLGIETVGCCCGHGKAGQITEYENGFGTWREYEQPPQALIRATSRDVAIKNGYRPYTYIYADGSHSDLLVLPLKTGCLNYDECVAFNVTYPVSCER